MSEEYSTTLRRNNERLQAELAETKKQLGYADWTIELLEEKETAVALRVKELEGALLLSEAKLQHYNGDYQGGPHIKDVRDAIKAALASTDKTADEVLKEAWGEPVGEVVFFGDPSLKEVSWKKGRMPDIGTKLYAPRTEVTK